MQVASQEPAAFRARLHRGLARNSNRCQLGLILLTVYLFELEKQHHFSPMLCLSVLGFFVHNLLSLRLRPAFFSLLSIAAFHIPGVDRR